MLVMGVPLQFMCHLWNLGIPIYHLSCWHWFLHFQLCQYLHKHHHCASPHLWTHQEVNSVQYQLCVKICHIWHWTMNLSSHLSHVTAVWSVSPHPTVSVPCTTQGISYSQHTHFVTCCAIQILTVHVFAASLVDLDISKGEYMQLQLTYALPHTTSPALSTQSKITLAIHALASQHPAPLVGPMCVIPWPSTLASGSFTSTQYLPLLLHPFPLASTSPSSVPPKAAVCTSHTSAMLLTIKFSADTWNAWCTCDVNKCLSSLALATLISSYLTDSAAQTWCVHVLRKLNEE